MERGGEERGRGSVVRGVLSTDLHDWGRLSWGEGVRVGEDPRHAGSRLGEPVERVLQIAGHTGLRRDPCLRLVFESGATQSNVRCDDTATHDTTNGEEGVDVPGSEKRGEKA